MKTGRPTVCTPEVIAEICQRLAEGESIRHICADENMPSTSAVFAQLAKNQDFQDQYARARELQAERMAEEILDIADDGTNDWMEREDGTVSLNGEHVQRSRLRVDTRKWLMSKMLPKKYGDRIQQDVSLTDETVEALTAGRERARLENRKKPES